MFVLNIHLFKLIAIYFIFIRDVIKNKFPSRDRWEIVVVLYLIFLLTAWSIYLVDKEYGSTFEDWYAETELEEMSQEEDLKPLPIGDIESAKQQCEEIGFIPKTEKFGECVLELNE